MDSTQVNLHRVSPVWLTDFAMEVTRDGGTWKEWLYVSLQEAKNRFAKLTGDQSLDLILTAYYYGNPKNILIIEMGNDWYAVLPTIEELQD